MFRKILVALDGSAAAARALQTAVQLARTHGASLHALGVEEHLPHYAATVGEVEEFREELGVVFGRIMDEARRVAASQGITLSTEVRTGHAAQQIVEAARADGVDPIVMGAKGHSSSVTSCWARRPIGSATTRHARYWWCASRSAPSGTASPAIDPGSRCREQEGTAESPSRTTREPLTLTASRSTIDSRR